MKINIAGTNDSRQLYLVSTIFKVYVVILQMSWKAMWYIAMI